jgi:predicted phage terminase large subunit-like protein
MTSPLITPEQIEQIPLEEREHIFRILQDIERVKKKEQARDNFMAYVEHMWPSFIKGKHHVKMADAFDRVIKGQCRRLIINMAPRFTKSEFSSFYLPSKYLGHYPDRKIIQATHTADFSKAWGRKVRNLVATPKYQALFPGTELVPDSKAAGQWSTSAGGEYYAVGTGGNIAGKGADLFIIDDPHSEQDYIRALGGDAAAFEDVFTWFQTGPRQRLQPNAAIVIVMTRWHMRDLTGKLIKRMASNPDADQWEIIELPATFGDDTEDDPLRSLWPEFWPVEELRKTKSGLSVAQWNAQYLQHPTAEEGALVKREWWQIWESDKPPNCDYVIQSWDTAFSKKESADYSACTTWGVFDKADDEGVKRKNIILLDAYKERMDFPKLKQTALELYKEREPDAFIIEGKATGMPLIHELRMLGIPVSEFTPTRGNDKVVRVNAVSDLFASGIVWCPATRWAEEVMEEFAAFPVGEHDDYVDSSTQALLRFRQGGFIPLKSDDEDDKPFYGRRFSPY